MDQGAKDLIPSDKILTLPNLLSFLRLIGVPFFLVLVLIGADLAAVIFLAVASFTDLIDGRIARRFNQVSKLGEMLDPAADRLYILAIVIGLACRSIVPWWFLIILASRDLTMMALVPWLRTRGFTSLPAHFTGKAATFCLLFALPLVLLGAGEWAISPLCKVLGWASALWGAFLYWWAGIGYIRQTIQLLSDSEPLTDMKAAAQT